MIYIFTQRDPFFTDTFLEEFDKIDIDEISPRQSLEFLYKLKSKRQSNGRSKFKK